MFFFTRNSQPKWPKHCDPVGCDFFLITHKTQTFFLIRVTKANVLHLTALERNWSVSPSPFFKVSSLKKLNNNLPSVNSKYLKNIIVDVLVRYFLSYKSLSLLLLLLFTSELLQTSQLLALLLCLCILIKAVFRCIPNEMTLFTIQEVFMGCMLTWLPPEVFGAEGSHMWVGRVTANCLHRYAYTHTVC